MFTFFYPGWTFPSISVTGASCELNCLHCNHHYLKGMVNAGTPEALYSFLKRLTENGGIGALISGGSTHEGKVPLAPFLPTLARIKKETDLILNVHTGFIEKNEAEALFEAGVDVVSCDVVGDRETAQKVYGLNKGPEDHKETLCALKEAGIPYIVPHVTVGLHFGDLKGESNALRMIREVITPDSIVINVLIPTKGTPMESFSPPSNKDVLEVIWKAVELFDVPVCLGCMRPRNNPELEVQGREMGLAGIVLPTRGGRKEIEKKVECRVAEVCCAVLPLLDNMVKNI